VYALLRDVGEGQVGIKRAECCREAARPGRDLGGRLDDQSLLPEVEGEVGKPLPQLVKRVDAVPAVGAEHLGNTSVRVSVVRSQLSWANPHCLLQPSRLSRHSRS
jgi:hypothetical protein